MKNSGKIETLFGAIFHGGLVSESGTAPFDVRRQKDQKNKYK